MPTVVTVSPLRSILGRRLGPYAALADFDDALAYALSTLGLAVTNRLAVADSDLVSLLGTQVDQVLDVAEWRMLETICANCTAAEFAKVGLATDPDRALVYLNRRLTALWARIERTYSIGLPTLQTGVLDLNSLQQGDGTVNY